MTWFIYLFFFILLLVPFIAIKPTRSRKAAMSPFTQTIIAHRGLFDNEGDAPENTLPAFKKAITGNYGIELDVQLSADHVPIVHHDFSLKRLAHSPEKIITKTAQELGTYPLCASTATIPTLQEVLDLVDGQVPLIIEIKNTDDNWRESASKVAALLDAYTGLYCVEAFDPRVIRWFKKNRPQVLRGILSTNFFKSKKEMSFFKKATATHLWTNFLIGPDFIAYNYRYKNQLFYWLCRKLYHPINAAWTVRDKETLHAVQDDFQIVICDTFLPDERSSLNH